MRTSPQTILKMALHSLKRQMVLERANRDYAALQHDQQLRQMREQQREHREPLEQDRLDRRRAAHEAPPPVEHA